MTLSRRTMIKLGLALSLSEVMPIIGTASATETAPSSGSADDVFSQAAIRALREDAAIAWQFFEQPGNFLPGLCPATTWPQGDDWRSYDVVTTWDTGSIILACIAARALDIIDDAEFDRRISGIMTFLGRVDYRWRGKPLPNYRSNIIHAGPVERGYDATDTARLFVALHVLDQFTGKSYDASKVVKRWDVPSTIIEGKLHDIKDDKIMPAEVYLYGFYVSRGYDLWSFSHKPMTSITNIDHDTRKAALEEIAKIGQIATEPSLNEEVELGHSQISRLIADTLYDAQERRFRETGLLTAVSEAPLDEQPWFTYQGNDLNTKGEDAWVVHSHKTDPRWKGKKFAQKFRMLNAKAAFLWYATRPNSYTEKLVARIRANGRSPSRGYYPGLFEASGKPPNIVDVNTNATILESIAYALNGRQPLTKLKAGQQPVAKIKT